MKYIYIIITAVLFFGVGASFNTQKIKELWNDYNKLKPPSPQCELVIASLKEGGDWLLVDNSLFNNKLGLKLTYYHGMFSTYYKVDMPQASYFIDDDQKYISHFGFLLREKLILQRFSK